MKKEDYESLREERDSIKNMLEKGTKHRVKLESRLKEIRGMLSAEHKKEWSNETK